MDKLIEKLEDEVGYFTRAKEAAEQGPFGKNSYSYKTAGVVLECLADCITHIKEHSEGKVLVPRGFIAAAGCTDVRCIDGKITEQVADQEFWATQCQFCYEKGVLLSSAQRANKDG